MNYLRSHPRLKWTIVVVIIIVLAVLYLSLLGSGSGATEIAPLPH